jgi:hypothetical protein
VRAKVAPEKSEILADLPSFTNKESMQRRLMWKQRFAKSASGLCPSLNLAPTLVETGGTLVMSAAKFAALRTRKTIRVMKNSVVTVGVYCFWT